MIRTVKTVYLESDEATRKLGARVARCCIPPLVIFLRGDLGSGKTTFARGFVRELGYPGRVKSPTFSLEESYVFENMSLFHFDLYRIRSSHEVEFIGIRDVMAREDAVCLIEWPERAGEAVQEADLEFAFAHQGSGRSVLLQARSVRGGSIIGML